MSTDPTRRAWVEIDRAALLRNLRHVRASVGPAVGVVPMVKANAYGLGVEGAVATLSSEDPWGFGVATVAEGEELRRLGWAGRVVVFSPAPPDEISLAVEAGLQLAVSDAATLRVLRGRKGQGAAPAFHVEVDTGMGRAGFPDRDVARWAGAVRDAVAAGAHWAGVFTHLHSADEGAASVREQWERLQRVLQVLDPPDGVAVHALNSAGALRCPEYAGDFVRPGIFLYGGRAGCDLPEPDPVAAVRARVVRVQDAAVGDTLGYGATHRAERPERWATVALGYGDGLPRGLSNGGPALVRGRRVTIVGRISMDVTVVDVSDVDAVEPGDMVTFLGRDGSERITVDQVAGYVGTISYEILTGLAPRLPRVWIDGGS